MEKLLYKNGSFKLNSDGNIVNANGYPLLLKLLFLKCHYSYYSKRWYSYCTDPQTGTTSELGQITIADFINPAGLTPLGDSLFMKSDASGDVLEGNPTTEQFGSLQQGMIEQSNVKLVNEMVDLITAQRAYEANSKAITTADSMLDTVNRLKKLISFK